MTHRLHRVEHGHGTPIIFVHGFTVDHRLLLPLERVFDDRPGWRRVYVDLPGHGRTPADGIEASADAIADVIEATIAETVGEARFAICGNSFGGQMARAMVPRFSDRLLGIALIAPVVRPLADRNRAVHRVFAGPDDVDLTRCDDALVAEFSANAVRRDLDAWRSFSESVAPGLAEHDRTFADRLWSSFHLSTMPEAEFATFDGPSLVMTGRQDAAVGFDDQRDLLGSYPRMTYAALDRAGHNVHLDQPGVTRVLMGEWLDRLGKEESA